LIASEFLMKSVCGFKTTGTYEVVKLWLQETLWWSEPSRKKCSCCCKLFEEGGNND